MNKFNIYPAIDIKDGKCVITLKPSDFASFSASSNTDFESP